MSTPSMVEKVRNAIHESSCKRMGLSPSLVEPHAGSLDDARAAIKAMREPNEEQITKLTNVIRACAWSRENVIMQYRWIIDAALAEPNQP